MYQWEGLTECITILTALGAFLGTGCSLAAALFVGAFFFGFSFSTSGSSSSSETSSSALEKSSPDSSSSVCNWYQIYRRIVGTNENTRIYTFFLGARFLGAVFLVSAFFLAVVLDFSTVPSSAVFCSHSSFSAQRVGDEMIDYLGARPGSLLWLFIFLASLCLRFLLKFRAIRLGLRR